MMSAQEWPAVFSVKHPDSTYRMVQSFVSCRLLVSQFCRGKPRPATGSWLHCSMFFYSFKLCVNDGDIQQKREGEVQTETFKMRWKVKTRGLTEIGMKGRHDGAWKVKDLEGGGGVWATVGLWLKPSHLCVSVCAPIGQGAWSETVPEELYQTWSHNRDSMKISSCYYSTHS